MDPAPVDAALLAGVRVLELSQQLSGPYAGMLLADLGADVIKIESPSRPDPARRVPSTLVGDQSTYFLSLNRNKRSVALDLKDAAGRAAFLRLVANSDVVFDNFRPGVAARLGIDHDSLSAHNPAIVTCSLTGFGETGPLRLRPGYDYLMQALCGTMSLTGEPDGPPTKYGISVVDHVGGLFAAMGILAALRGRDSDPLRRGRHIDLSLFDAHLSMLSYLATDFLNGGEEPQRHHHSAHPRIVPAQAFETADGWIVVMPLAEHFWPPLCRALGRLDLATDPRFATADDRLAHRDDLVRNLEPEFRRRPTSRLLEVLVAEGVPAAPVQGMADALAMEHVSARRMIVSATHPQYGSYRGIGNPVKVSGAPEPLPAPPPVLGEHTAQVLREVAEMTEAEVASLAGTGPRPPVLAEAAGDADELLVRCDDGVLEIVINRPHRRNALTPELMGEISRTLEAARTDDDARAIVIAGTGNKAFCAGFDIHRIESAGTVTGGQERDLADRLATQVREHPLPVIAAVNGAAMGAGCDLAIACDIRVGCELSRFGIPTARLGLLYGWAGLERLVHAVGLPTAKHMLLTGEALPGDRAHALGLLAVMVPPGDVLQRAHAIARSIAENAPLSVRASKRISDIAARHALTDAESAEIDRLQAAVWNSEDSTEGARAFREGRAPQFTGR